MADTRRFIEELHRAWRDEKGAALTYAAAASHETDARRRDIFLRMAAEEEKHAARWEERLRELMSRGSLEEVFAELVFRDDPERVARDIADVVAAAGRQLGSR